MDIRLEHIHKEFAGKLVFNDYSCVFELGLVHVFVGASGCGKTTLLRLLMNLDEEYSGKIIGLEKLAKAAVFQEDRLLESLSVTANLKLVNEELSDKEIEAHLKGVALADVAHKKVEELSGGMKRRVSIIRALVAESDVLFFDEALKGMDKDTELQVVRYLLPFLKSKTVFWTTHDQNETTYFKKHKIHNL